MIDDDKSVFKLKINENNPPSNKIKEPKFGFVLNRSRIIIAIAKKKYTGWVSEKEIIGIMDGNRQVKINKWWDKYSRLKTELDLSSTVRGIFNKVFS